MGQLLRQRLVIGRSAADRGGDIEVFQFKAVITGIGSGLIGKSGLVEDRIHEFTGRIPCKRTSSAVRAMGAGREAEDQDTRMGISEAGNGLAPVLPIDVCATLLARDLLAILDQPRTPRAGNNFAIQLD